MPGATESRFLSGYPNYEMSSGIRATCHCPGVAMDATHWQWYVQLPQKHEKHRYRSCTAWLTFQHDELKPHTEGTMAGGLIKSQWHWPGLEALKSPQNNTISDSSSAADRPRPWYYKTTSLLRMCKDCDWLHLMECILKATMWVCVCLGSLSWEIQGHANFPIHCESKQKEI